MLGTLHDGVTRLGEQAQAISSELESQSRVIDDLTDDVDTASHELTGVAQNIKRLLQTQGQSASQSVIFVRSLRQWADNCQISIILCLIVVLVVLVVLVIAL